MVLNRIRRDTNGEGGPFGLSSAARAAAAATMIPTTSSKSSKVISGGGGSSSSAQQQQQSAPLSSSSNNNSSNNAVVINNNSNNPNVSTNTSISWNPNTTNSLSESNRSWKSFISASNISDEGYESSLGPPSRPTSVHGNLMRSRRQRDPKRYYQVIEVLGEGSMGSVAKVRKRPEAVGGSARKHYVTKEKGCCFVLLSNLNLIPSMKPKFDQLTPLNGSDQTPLRGSSKHVISSSLDDTNMDFSQHSAMSLSNKYYTPTKSGSGSGSGKSGSKGRSIMKHTSSQISYGSSSNSKRKKRGGSYYALKSIHLDRCTTPEYVKELRNEVEILKSLDHPNIVRAMETFDWHDRLYLVLEICSGGDLYTRDPYTENQACKIIHNLLSAIAYLHDHDIIHRDLKFENIMFSDSRPESEIKLIDFGLSQKFARNEHLRDAVGTVYTMAPELLAGDYNYKADVWSVGVITFMLISSSLPFYGKDRVRVIKKIISGKYSFSSRRWRRVSPEAKMFVRDLLTQDPEKRPSAEEALSLDWMKQEHSESNEFHLNDAMDKVQANIEAFASYSKLKKLALMVIAYKSTNDEIGGLKKMFQKYDKSNNGVISLDEFKETLSDQYEYSLEELERMFNGIDVDGSGTVHYCEFLAATLESEGAIDEERIAEAFDRIDSDDTGYITVEDLQEFLGDEIPIDYLEDIIEESDLQGDHRISYEEFLELWNGQSDMVLAGAQIDVKLRRERYGSRQNSLDSLNSLDSAEFDSGGGPSSAVSSLSGDELTESERSSGLGTPRAKAKRDPGAGSKAFLRAKREVSLRGNFLI